MPKIIENRDSCPPRRKANTFRIIPQKGKFIIEFGNLNKKRDQVNVLFSIWIDSNALSRLVVRAFKAGVLYQEKYKEDIGFTIPETDKEKVLENEV